MLLQQLLVLPALACTALATNAYDAADDPASYVMTVRHDVYSTEYATVTVTGEPPLVSPANSPSTVVYTTAVSTLEPYSPPASGTPGYSYTNSTAAATPANPPGNATVSSVPSASMPPAETGAASAPAGFRSARLLAVAVLALSWTVLL